MLLSFPSVFFLVIYTLNNSSLLCNKRDEMCVAVWVLAATTCVRGPTPFPWGRNTTRQYVPHELLALRNTPKHEAQTNDKHLNENANLLSVWSWLNILSDLYDYGNHTFDFSRGREAAEPNRLSRLRRFDISWNTSEDDDFFFFFWIITEQTHMTLVGICARVGKYNWFLVRTDGRTKLKWHWKHET